MSFFSGMIAKNAYDVLIGKSISRTSSVQITDPSAATYIADGEILVLDYNDQPLTPGSTISDSPFIRIVQRSGSNLRYSMRIDGLHVNEYRGISGTNGQEQIYFVGYNGTSGSINATSTSRMFKITYKFDDKWACQPYRKSYPSNKTTQVGIVDDIVPAMNVDSHPALMGNGAAAGFVKAERLCNNAGSTDATATTITISKGSNVGTLGASATTFVVGDYLRIGGTTDTTIPVYKITALSGTTVTFDTPFQGNSVSGVNINYITAATAATANWGIKLTGLSLSFGVYPGKQIPFNKTSFDVHVGSDWGSTTLTKSQEMTFGTGQYEQVVYMEQMGKVFSGVHNLGMVPIPSAMTTLDSAPGTLYDCVYISFADVSSSLIAPNAVSDHQTYLFFVDGASQTTSVLAQLDPWMNSTPKQFNPIASL